MFFLFALTEYGHVQTVHFDCKASSALFMEHNWSLEFADNKSSFLLNLLDNVNLTIQQDELTTRRHYSATDYVHCIP